LEVFRGDEEDELRNMAFSYSSMRKMFDKIGVKAIHTGRKITYSHLRKFFEQVCNNVLTVQLSGGRVVPAVPSRAKRLHHGPQHWQLGCPEL